MEKINYNANQQNLPNKLFLILSIVSWLLISINNLASLKWLYREPNVVWNIYAYGFDFPSPLESNPLGNIPIYRDHRLPSNFKKIQFLKYLISSL